MGKKQGVNSKVEAANERKASQKAEKDRQKAAQDEKKAAAEWSEGANLKQSQKAQEREQKQLEALAKKAEKKRLEEEENASLKSQAKKVKVKSKDIPPWEAALQEANTKTKADKAREARMKQMERELKEEEERKRLAEEKERRRLKRGDEDEEEEEDADYELSQIIPQNTNRMQSDFQVVSGLDAILSDLSVSDNLDDKHPEKRRKALYNAYLERMLPQVREEFPGLKLSQYKQRIFDMWQRAPENPSNASV